jgi:hypothetical protein
MAAGRLEKSFSIFS